MSAFSKAGPPYGNPNAPSGGSLTVGINMYPKSLVHYLAGEDMVVGINDYVFDALVSMDPVTWDIVPSIAKSWKISKDKMTFTFELDPTAKFSDGNGVTADDVKFTWDAIFNPKNQTVPAQAVFSSFEGVKILSSTSVEFKAKVSDYRNLEKLSNFYILPKHIYSKGDFNRDYNEKLIGSGPYTLEEAKRGEKIVLKRNPKYWASKMPINLGRYNIETLTFKVHEDNNVQYELFKKGDLDYFMFNQAKMWAQETDGPIYQNGYVKKLKGEHKVPGGMSGIAWNLRKPMFQDLKVRLALSHLLNREKMIPELFFNNYTACTGIIAVNSEYHSPKIKPVPYNPKKAQTLFREAGWTSLSDDGVLMKGKDRFEFDLILNNPAYQRVLTGYVEDLRKVGIKMNIRLMEWATSIKVRDEHKYDAIAVAYTRDVNPGSFGKMWASDQAELKGSDNFMGYKNPEVDKLCSQIDQEYDKKKRIKLVHALDEIIAADQPWTFFWEMPYFRVAYWQKYSFPKGMEFQNFSLWRNSFDYWWFDADKDAKLKAARAENKKVNL